MPSGAAAPTETTAASDELVHSPVLDALEDFFSEPDFTSAINDFACMHAPTIVPLAEGEEPPEPTPPPERPANPPQVFFALPMTMTLQPPSPSCIPWHAPGHASAHP